MCDPVDLQIESCHPYCEHGAGSMYCKQDKRPIDFDKSRITHPRAGVGDGIVWALEQAFVFTSASVFSFLK